MQATKQVRKIINDALHQGLAQRSLNVSKNKNEWPTLGDFYIAICNLGFMYVEPLAQIQKET